MSELSKVLYRCRRGTKELDLLTQKYAIHCFENASREERDAFTQLLELQDPQLYFLLVEQNRFDDPIVQSIVYKIRDTSM